MEILEECDRLQKNDPIPAIKWLLFCRQTRRNGVSVWQDRNARNSNSSQWADSRNGCVARVTEIPAKVVLHEHPSDIPTCCRQTLTNVILLQTPFRVVTWKARCNYTIRTLNPGGSPSDGRHRESNERKLNPILLLLNNYAINSQAALIPKVWRTYNDGFNYITISPFVKNGKRMNARERERENKREKKRKERKKRGNGKLA